MLIIILFFSLIVVIPYSIYFKKNFDLSKNKELFLRENLYRSTIWLVPLIIIPIFIINQIFPSEKPVEPPSEEKKSIEELQAIRDSHSDSLAFHKLYIERYFESSHSKTWDQSLKQYYLKIYQSDSLKNFGAWGLGYVYFKFSRPDSSIFYLSQVSDQELPELNLLLARAYKKKNNDSLYHEYLIKEASNVSGNREDAFKKLQVRIQQNNDEFLLDRIRNLPDAAEYINPHTARKIYYEAGSLFKYYQSIWQWYIKQVNVIDIVAAFLILIVWLLYLVKLSFFDSINWSLLISIVSFEIIVSFLTFLINDVFQYEFGLWQDSSDGLGLLLYSIFGIGAVEEFVKIIPILLIFLFHKKSLQPYHYILFASASALGFAFMENLLYFDSSKYGSIIHGRALTSAVGHMADSSIFAYGFVLTQFKRKYHPIIHILICWLLASITHGLYDYFLFKNMMIVFVMFFFLTVRVWNTLINNCINNSQHFIYTRKFKIRPIQFFLAFSLTSILMFEYIIVGITQGSYNANLSISVAAFSGSFLIMFLGSKLSTIDLIKGHWSKVNLSVNPFTDDIVSQNFIGEKILLSPYHYDNGLALYCNAPITGLIVNRMILQNKPANFFLSYEDPNWFLVKLNTPLQTDDHRNNIVMIKFKTPQSSLNFEKPVIASLLLIPKVLSEPKKMRKNFTSLGWCFLSTK